jgi:hypothetical protein
MDPASQALAQNLPPNVRRTYAALAKHSDGRVSRTTVWYRAKGRPSRRTKAQNQQYLTLSEEKAFQRLLIGATGRRTLPLDGSMHSPS